jgi:hypothetical protein
LFYQINLDFIEADYNHLFISTNSSPPLFISSINSSIFSSKKSLYIPSSYLKYSSSKEPLEINYESESGKYSLSKNSGYFFENVIFFSKFFF